MELVQLHGLLQCRGNSLFELFKLVKSLSYTQAQINLLVGRSLPFQASVKKMTKYLGYLNIIEDIEIRGFTLEKSTVFIQEFISGYYKTLENLHQNPHNNRVKEIILSQITAHVLEKADVYLQDLICKYKAKAPSRNSMILQAWTCLELSYNSAKYLFTTCCKWYLKSKKISLKYERTHCIVFALVINLLKNHQKLIWKKREQISGMFIKSQSFCRKYIEHKISKEKIFLLSCEFIILTVSNVKILKSGLKNVSFPVTFGKTSYAESYISYFFKQTYGILKRPTISIRLILQSKSYLLSYLKSNTEYITPALNSFQSCLQVSEERDLQKAFILVIHELFQIASAELRENIIIPYVLMCYHELSKHAAADLIHSILPLVPEHMLKSLDPIFTLTRSNPEQSQVAWVRKISKGLTSQQKAFEILDDLLIIYSSSYNSKEICNEIVKTLYVFTQNFSNAVIGKVVITVVELLVLHEKLLWIRNQTHDSEMIILAAFALLNVTKSCMEKNKKNLDFQVMNMFWCIVTHFQLQYPLEDLVSIRDLNENLQGLAKVTPNLFQLEQKDLNSVFLHLFQAPNYTKVFLPKLKTYLASICSKK